MTFDFESALDQSVTLYRLPEAADGGGFAGDQSDTFSALGDPVPARRELTLNDEWTVWIIDDSNTPEYRDRMIFDDGMHLEISRVKPWTDFDGDHHHFEITATEVFGTRIYADRD